MATFKTDIEIAQETPMLPISQIAEMAGVDDKYLEQQKQAKPRYLPPEEGHKSTPTLYAV